MVINTTHSKRALRHSLLALVIAGMVGGCTGISNLYETIEGGMSGEKVRTVPRGGMTQLGPKRMPVNNPAGGRMAVQHPQMSPSDYYAAQSQAVAAAVPEQHSQSHPAYYDEPYRGQPSQPGFFERNVSSLMGDSTPAAGGPRKVPAENQPHIASDVTQSSAPIAAMQKELGMGSYQGQIDVAPASSPIVEVPVAADTSVASSGWVAGDDDSYPDLRAVPETPEVTPSSEHQHAVSELEQDRMVAERARQAFLSEEAVAPALATPPAMASDGRPDEDDGFGAWLNDLFEPGEVESQQTAMAPPVAPSEPKALMEPMEPTEMMPLEPTAPAMERVAVAPAPEPMPAHLPHIPEFDNEPSPYDQRVFNSDEDSVPWGAQGGPVTLKAPSLSPQQVYTLPESRYAGRRAAARSGSSAR